MPTPVRVWPRAFGTGLTCLVLATVALGAPPNAAADPISDLDVQLAQARTDAGCPALQLDDALNGVSQTTVTESADWVMHRGRFLPKEDKTVSEALRDVGLAPTKARMLTGFGDYRTGGGGDDMSKAIFATIVQGSAFEVFEDCSYTKYGRAIASDPGAEGWPSSIPRSFAMTSVIVTNG